MPYATAPDGTRIYYETMGAGEPLLLISGQGGDHHTWDEVREDFAARYRVVLFDHRGTGASDKPEKPPYTTRGFAQDVVAILDDLGIRRAHAYGVSMGGRICQWLGIEHGDRLGALVLGCTTPGNAHGVRRPPELDAALVNAEHAAMLARMVSPAWMAKNPAYLAHREELLKHPIPDYTRKLHFGASEGHDSWDLLPKIKVPTLVIHGTDDQVNMTANAPLLAERIPGVELYLVKGGRHAYFVEFQEEASRVVLNFLARHPIRS